MNLLELAARTSRPIPWAEGEKIPWDEPSFSARMLREHLTQDHDAASRRSAIIDQQIGWIHGHVLAKQSARILDLGCGPGLYLSRLAALGHDCTGIDFSPASIAFAQAQQPRCRYIHSDIRQADYGSGYDLVMLIFGEFNTFNPEDARLILRKAHAALKPTGRIVLEPHTYDAVREIGEQPASWYSSQSGLFSEQPHFVLQESFWEAPVATERYFIVDAATATVTRYACSMQAYHEADYAALLSECGFSSTSFYPSLAGHAAVQPQLLCVIANKS